jgi:hypothetical protein
MPGVGVIVTASPTESKSGEVEAPNNGRTQFNFEVDKTGTIEVVRLSRVPILK